jgi:hypothetical protein
MWTLSAALRVVVSFCAECGTVADPVCPVVVCRTCVSSLEAMVTALARCVRVCGSSLVATLPSHCPPPLLLRWRRCSRCFPLIDVGLTGGFPCRHQRSHDEQKAMLLFLRGSVWPDASKTRANILRSVLFKEPFWVRVPSSLGQHGRAWGLQVGPP